MNEITPHSLGDRIIVRTVTNGKIRWASGAFLVEDSSSELAFFLPSERISKVTKGCLVVSSRREREAALRDELQSGEWELVDKVPYDKSPRLVLSRPDQWFSVFLRPMGNNGNYVAYYVNFQRPYLRTKIGFDTDDLCLDLILNSRKFWEVKDEKDYRERVKLVRIKTLVTLNISMLRGVRIFKAYGCAQTFYGKNSV